MEPAALALAGLIWHGSTEIATGRAHQGPWEMNESRFEFVDDPTAAIDERGAISVAWVDQARKDVFFQRFDASGKKVGQPVNVSRSPNIFSWLPRIALDPKGRVFVLWQEIIFSGGSHGGDILFARSDDRGRSFSEPQNLSSSVAGDGKGRINKDVWHNGSLDIAVGPDGTVYTAWTEYEGLLWVRRSRDGGRTFSDKLKIVDTKPARAPALAAADKTVYLAWTVGDDESADIRVAKSTDGGASFGAARIVDKSKGYSDAPKLAVDARGVLHLVYGEGARILYTRSAEGVSFERPRAISESGAGFPALALDGKGNLYVLWERFTDLRSPPRGLALTVSADGGKTFSAPVLVPESADAGWNGGSQGMLMRKLAVNRDGAIAIVNSSFKENDRSRVWLVRGQLSRK